MIVRSIKFGKDGKIYCGTNKGILYIIDSDSVNFRTVNLNCSTIVDLDIINDNELIISAHNNRLFILDLRFVNTKTNVIEFKEHFNECKKIKFSRDKRFQTLTSVGQDNIVRIWSEKSGNLIRTINYKDLVDNVRQNIFTDDYILDDNFNQIFSSEKPPVSSDLQISLEASSSASSSASSVANQRVEGKCLDHYTLSTQEQYQAVLTSDWLCLSKEPRITIFGSNSNSIDSFF